MATMLAGFIINIITSLSSLILTPFVSSIFALFPDLTDKLQYFNYIVSIMFQYIGVLMKLMLIDDTMATFLFGFILIRFSIYIIMSSVRFILRAYNYLKP